MTETRGQRSRPRPLWRCPPPRSAAPFTRDPGDPPQNPRYPHLPSAPAPDAALGARCRRGSVPYPAAAPQQVLTLRPAAQPGPPGPLPPLRNFGPRGRGETLRAAAVGKLAAAERGGRTHVRTGHRRRPAPPARRHRSRPGVGRRAGGRRRAGPRAGAATPGRGGDSPCAAAAAPQGAGRRRLRAAGPALGAQEGRKEGMRQADVKGCKTAPPNSAGSEERGGAGALYLAAVPPRPPRRARTSFPGSERPYAHPPTRSGRRRSPGARPAPGTGEQSCGARPARRRGCGAARSGGCHRVPPRPVGSGSPPAATTCNRGPGAAPARSPGLEAARPVGLRGSLRERQHEGARHGCCRDSASPPGATAPCCGDLSDPRARRGARRGARLPPEGRASPGRAEPPPSLKPQSVPWPGSAAQGPGMWDGWGRAAGGQGVMAAPGRGESGRRLVCGAVGEGAKAAGLPLRLISMEARS